MLDTPPDAPVVRAAGAACRDLGLDGSPTGLAYGSDAGKLWAVGGVPSVGLGPGAVGQAHTADEYVPLAHLPLAVEVYARTAVRLAALPGGA